MGILNKAVGKKEEKKTDSFWIETEYGYAPKDEVKVHFSPDRDAFRGYSKSISIDASIEEYQRLKALEKKIYKLKELLVGSCINCDKNFLIPAKRKPIFFKCPFCSPKEEKSLIESLLFLNPNNEIFICCPGCSKYSFLVVDEQQKYFNFRCKVCKKEFLLKKDHEIKVKNLSNTDILCWCPACGTIFESPRKKEDFVICPHCNTRLKYET